MSIDVELAVVEARNCDFRWADKPRLSFASTSMKPRQIQSDGRSRPLQNPVSSTIRSRIKRLVLGIDTFHSGQQISFVKLTNRISVQITFHRAHFPQKRLGFDSVVVNATCGLILSPNRVFRIRHFSITRKKMK